MFIHDARLVNQWAIFKHVIFKEWGDQEQPGASEIPRYGQLKLRNLKILNFPEHTTY